ncbi:TPA: hypothetical protein ACGXND_005116 [Bacillus tropicus]
MFEIEYQNGMNLGLGYNSFTGLPLPSSALDDINQIRSVVNATGQKVTFHIDLIKNKLLMLEQLNISASTSFSFGQSSGSAKVRFAQSFKQNSYTIYVLVRVHVQNEQTLLDLTKVKFNANVALQYLTNPKMFYRQYGTGFIYGILSGGDYIGVLEIESKSVEQYRQIKANLSGKGLFGVMSGGASFEQVLKEITSSYNVKATVERDGGEGEIGNIQPEQLIKDALNFPSKVLKGQAVPFSVLYVPYEQIPHPERELPKPDYTDCLEVLGKEYSKFQIFTNDLLYAIENKEMFPGIDINDMESRLDAIQVEMERIEKQAKEFILGYDTNCEQKYNTGLIDRKIIPPQVMPSKLGDKWYWEHDDFLGVFRKEDNDNDKDTVKFTGKFSKPENGQLKEINTTLKVDEKGDVVYIYREDGGSEQKRFIYKGKISEDGTEIQVSNYPIPKQLPADFKYMTIKIYNNVNS